LDRNEAVTYLKELLKACNDMSPEAVSFEQPKNQESIGYTVRIKGFIDAANKQAVNDIARKHSLTVKEENCEVLIYKSSK
jgi:hypothetical protein